MPYAVIEIDAYKDRNFAVREYRYEAPLYCDNPISAIAIRSEKDKSPRVIEEPTQQQVQDILNKYNPIISFSAARDCALCTLFLQHEIIDTDWICVRSEVKNLLGKWLSLSACIHTFCHNDRRFDEYIKNFPHRDMPLDYYSEIRVHFIKQIYHVLHRRISKKVLQNIRTLGWTLQD